MKLYEINEAIENCVDTETGEILDEAALDALKIEREEKIRNIAAWIVNLKADAKAYKERADEFTARKKTAENKAESLERYLSNQLDGKAWKDSDFSVTFRMSKATDIYDESKIPVDYLIQQSPKIDKAGILRTLKMGKEIPGARLVERQSMTVK
jgi:hypothetical protein